MPRDAVTRKCSFEELLSTLAKPDDTINFIFTLRLV